ncbi:MAG: 3-phosphoshikimate 1-carboxyvinyltransferase [Ruminococcaceae bacterium]|nr:3-phosphoshikimate 1-carboxyvinyltransferase [Oscillospiraceae bacterium]
MSDKITVTPSLLCGKVAAIPSKSDAHRLLIASAFADRPTTLMMRGSSEDIDATIGCLRAIGAGIDKQADRVVVTPVSNIPPRPLLDCRESGSTLRFMLPVAAAVCESAAFVGQGRLPQRPIGELREALTGGGVAFSSDRLPFEISGRLNAGDYRLPGGISSQYITGMLMALPLTGGESEIILTDALRSGAYVDITLDVLKRFGIEIKKSHCGYLVPAGQRYRSVGQVDVDGDWSNGAFLLCMGAIGGSVTVTGLRAHSPQGDKAITDLLRRFGAKVTADGDSVTVSGGRLVGCEVDIDETPDLLPALAMVAAFAEGETRFVNGERLRIKESDRLAACADLLHDLGGDAEETADGLIVRGGGLRGGSTHGQGDHRIVMAAAIAAVGCTEEVTITGYGAVNKSYPAFFEDYAALGGKLCIQ